MDGCMIVGKTVELRNNEIFLLEVCEQKDILCILATVKLPGYYLRCYNMPDQEIYSDAE